MRTNTLKVLVGVAALVLASLAGVASAPSAAADECTGDCGAAAFTGHRETPPDPFYGELVKFVADVDDVNLECEALISCTPPRGSVEWYDGDAAQPFLSAPLHPTGDEYWWSNSMTPEDGVVYAGLSGGLHTIKMKYVPGEHEPASDEFEFTVYPRPTETTVDAGNAAVGQTVTVTAMVNFEGQIDEANGAQRPAGLVEFYRNGTSLGTAPVSNGTAQINIPFTSAGSNTLLAHYLGDGNYDWSLSPAKDVTVGKGDTSITLNVPAGPTVYGQPVSFTGTVAVTPPAQGFPPVPTGTLTFGPVGNGPAASVNNYHLQANYPTMSTGAHPFEFIYSGDANFNGSQVQFTHIVNKADTTTTLATPTPNPSNVGDQVTLSATVAVVAPGAGTPTGAVQFFDGTAALGAPVPLSGTTATLGVRGLGGGAHSITARYLGDGNFNPSTSAPQSHAVRCDVVVANVNGNYNVPASGSTCIVNGTITGSVMVPAGAALSITNSSIGGTLMSTSGARGIVICGSSLGDTTISNTSGALTVGSPYIAGCAGNTFRSNVAFQSNRAGVRFEGNRVAGGVQVSGTSGGATVIGGNTVSGWLQCSGNSPAATNGGHPNSAGGRTGECGAPSF